MTTAQFLIIATIIIYLGSMLLIGFHFNRKGSGASSGDFYLGGRNRRRSERRCQSADARTVRRSPGDFRRDLREEISPRRHCINSCIFRILRYTEYEISGRCPDRRRPSLYGGTL